MSKIGNTENIRENEFNSKITESLLKKLSFEIGQKFGIENEKAKVLIQKESFKSIQDLRIELQNQSNFLEINQIEELFKDLNSAKEKLKLTSKKDINNLKFEVKNNLIENNRSLLENNFPRKLVKTAQNPQKFHEHILGVSLGIANSTITIGETIGKIGLGFLKSPYDLYQVYKGKAEFESFRKI